MAKRNRLKDVAVAIGSAVGTAQSKARKAAKVGSVARKELKAISKELDSLRRQLQKTTKRIQKALR